MTDRYEHTLGKIEQKQRRRNQIVMVGGWMTFVVLMILGVLFLSFSLFKFYNKKTVKDNPSFATSSTVLPPKCDDNVTFRSISNHPCNFKIEFQDKYKKLTTKFLPSIEASSAEEFVQLGLMEITEFENKSINAFDKSDFQVAVKIIDRAIGSAEELTSLIAENFQLFFKNALNAFDEDDAVSAQHWIDRSLHLNVKDAAAQNLSSRIAVLPEVLVLYKLASEAAIQNQQLTLQKNLQMILALDKQRYDVSSRLVILTEELTKTKYNAHLQNASQYIFIGNTSSARQEVNKAIILYPNKMDAASLLAQINLIEKTERVDDMITEVKSLERQDSWVKALALYERLLKEDVLNRAVVNGHEKANKIVLANTRAINILNNQNRFQDENFQHRVIEYLKLIQPLSLESVMLAEKINTLEKRLNLWQKKVKVIVFSDGKSIISVRRVGRVGNVIQKSILLKPGEYDFECSRDGYKEKIIKHFVPPDQDDTSVTISCDVLI